MLAALSIRMTTALLTSSLYLGVYNTSVYFSLQIYLYSTSCPSLCRDTRPINLHFA